MNTVKYDQQTGKIVGYVSGATPTASEGYGVLYTTKDLPDLADVVVLGGMLVPRMSIEYALSDKSSTNDKTLFWKEHRAKLLSESDYLMLPDVGDTAFQERAKIYRQQLRDLPKHANWPSLTLADIPTKPNPNAIQLSVF